MNTHKPVSKSKKIKLYKWLVFGFLSTGLILGLAYYTKIISSDYSQHLFFAIFFCLVGCFIFGAAVEGAQSNSSSDEDLEADQLQITNLQRLQNLLKELPEQAAALRKSCEDARDFLSGHSPSGESDQERRKREDKIRQLEELLAFL